MKHNEISQKEIDLWKKDPEGMEKKYREFERALEDWHYHYMKEKWSTVDEWGNPIKEKKNEEGELK